MKKWLIASAFTAVSILQVQAAPAVAATASKATSQASSLVAGFKTAVEQNSYALGATLGQNMHKQSVKIDSQAFAQGFSAAYNGQSLRLTDTQLHQSMMAFQKQLIAQQIAKHQAQASKNSDAGQVFLNANKIKTGIVSLPDGLQYKVLHAGMGPIPAKTDTVKVDYEAKTIDGKVFDSSYKRGKPSVFKVADMIQGFQEALMLMKTGSTWQVFIPAKLAYGQHGVPGMIGPNQTLMFKIHLIDIVKPTAKPAAK